MDKKERETIEERVAVVNDVPRVVSFLLTFVGLLPVSTIKRYNRKTKTKEDISISLAQPSLEYNQHMGGVDLLDSHISRYKIRMKSRKWYLRLFFHFVDLAVINAWLMWRKIHKKTESLALFKEELGKDLSERLCISTITRPKVTFTN